MQDRIDLIYDQDCPNVEGARQAIRDACKEVGVAPEWREWDHEAPDTPDHMKRFGSPTVLVDGVDVADPGAEGDAKCCRVYDGPGGQ